MDLSSCICCWTGINALLYLASAIVQWIVIGNERADGVACLNGVALAGAILSSLATHSAAVVVSKIRIRRRAATAHACCNTCNYP